MSGVDCSSTHQKSVRLIKALVCVDRDTHTLSLKCSCLMSLYRPTPAPPCPISRLLRRTRVQCWSIFTWGLERCIILMKKTSIRYSPYMKGDFCFFKWNNAYVPWPNFYSNYATWGIGWDVRKVTVVHTTTQEPFHPLPRAFFSMTIFVALAGKVYTWDLTEIHK